VDRELAKIVKYVAEFGFTIDFGDQVRESLAHEGYDPVYGARPLRRAIQRRIENPLSRAIIAGDFKKGDKIRSGIKDGEVHFVKA
jgi:ATP-dependent Clp protease ATP-binding subunit ClpB